MSTARLVACAIAGQLPLPSGDPQVTVDRPAREVATAVDRPPVQGGLLREPIFSEPPPFVADLFGGSPDEVISSLGDLAPLFEEAQLSSRI